jgi:hypothetical protein
MDQVGDGASGADPTRPDTEFAGPYPPTDRVAPHPPTERVAPHPPTERVVPYTPTERGGAGQAAEVVRSGPGVPGTPPARHDELTAAERVWRTGRPPAAGRRAAGLRRRVGSALTVILLAATGVVLYLRFHHAAFRVTGVVISRQTRTACGVDVTGRIGTDGSAGTVRYEWLFRPGQEAPQPLSQSVIAGQHGVDVTVALEGSGQGSASQTVTLRLLGPDRGSASTAVVISC